MDDAIARQPKRKQVALELTTPEVRIYPGESFKGVPQDPTPEGHIAYGYTRLQCERMRAVILAAAAEDAGGAS